MYSFKFHGSSFIQYNLILLFYRPLSVNAMFFYASINNYNITMGKNIILSVITYVYVHYKTLVALLVLFTA